MAGTAANVANQAFEKGDVRAAIKGYHESLLINPNNAQTYYNLALAQLQVNDPAAAEGSLNAP